MTKHAMSVVEPLPHRTLHTWKGVKLVGPVAMLAVCDSVEKEKGRVFGECTRGTSVFIIPVRVLCKFGKVEKVVIT